MPPHPQRWPSVGADPPPCISPCGYVSFPKATIVWVANKEFPTLTGSFAIIVQAGISINHSMRRQTSSATAFVPSTIQLPINIDSFGSKFVIFEKCEAPTSSHGVLKFNSFWSFAKSNFSFSPGFSLGIRARMKSWNRFNGFRKITRFFINR